MTVPDFQTLMLPVLREYVDGAEHVYKEVRERLAVTIALSPEGLADIVPSGSKTRFEDRAAWAHTYLKQAGLLMATRRSIYQITPRGRELLDDPPEKITLHFLGRFPEYVDFKTGSRGSDETEPSPAESPIAPEPTATTVLTPDEQIRARFALLGANLAAQLLDRVKQATPLFFEQLVVKLLVEMGYGGSYADAAKVVGKSGDAGIDGIIKEDRLGLESIYVQAKRWQATVGRPDIQQFAGALHGNRARKGVFITTSGFSREATEYARNSQIAIVLIDGEQLADYMIEFGVGVSDVETIKLQKLDEDYLLEE